MENIKHINKSTEPPLLNTLIRIEEESKQEDLDEKKRANTRKSQLHYLFLLIFCLLISDALGWISFNTDFVGIAGIATKILSYFPKMNSS